MPKLEVQAVPRPIAARPVTNGMTSRIRPLEDAGDVGKLLMSIYGGAKSGKTRLAATLPKPILFLSPDPEGRDSIKGLKGIDISDIKKPDELASDVETLRSGRSWWRRNGDDWEKLSGPAGEPYASGVLDHATKLREMLLAEIMHVEEAPLKKPWGGKAMQNIWMPLAAAMQAALRPLIRIAKQDKLRHVMILSQEADLTHNEPDTPKENLIPPDIGAALGKGIADWLDAECSYIGQTLTRSKVKIIPATKNMPAREQKINGIDYCLRICPGDMCRAGFRVPVGVSISQEFLVDPTYEGILAIIKGNA